MDQPWIAHESSGTKFENSTSHFRVQMQNVSATIDSFAELISLSSAEWQMTVQTLQKLDEATKSLHATFKDFISMTFNENLMKSLLELRQTVNTVSKVSLILNKC